jgi:hypothetical protein
VEEEVKASEPAERSLGGAIWSAEVLNATNPENYAGQPISAANLKVGAG